MSLQSLPLPALRSIALFLGNDLASHVRLSQVDRELRAFYAYDISDETWRKLLARMSLGRSVRHADHSWYEMACAIVHHSGVCKLCRQMLDDIRSQYIYKHDPDGRCCSRTPSRPQSDHRLQL